MNIIFLSRLFYPHIGGVEKHVLEISKRLVKLGHRVTVVAEAVPQQIKNQPFDFAPHRLVQGFAQGKKSKIEKIDILRIPVGKVEWFKKFRIWWWLWKHRDLIKNADIIHCHDVFFWHLPFKFLYPKKPVYTTFHGYESYPVSRKAIVQRRIAEKLSNGNICVGDYIKKWYGTKPKFTTYGAVDKHNYHTTVRGSYSEKINILFIGRLDEQTGIMEYLKVVKILKDKGYKIMLDVLGNGILKDKAEDYCKRHDLDVKFYGFTNGVSNFLKKSDFVFCSRYLGILEAFVAKRLAFAVYDNPIKKDYLKMAPFARWVVIESSAVNLADKIMYFANHQEEKDKIVNVSYEWVKKQTWDEVVSEYLRLWQR